MASINVLFNVLDEQCERSLKCISEVCSAEYNTEEKKDLRDFVIKQAFVSVFTEWEHFLENSTIQYSLGETSVHGVCPERYVFPIDEDHADRLIRGTSSYPDWSKMDVVRELEKALFKNGEPYSFALGGISSKYKDMQKVRNHIVHNSMKSSKEFDTLVRNALSASKVGISPTEFLISKKKSAPRFYEQYINYIRIAAKQIAEYQPQATVDNEANIEEAVAVGVM